MSVNEKRQTLLIGLGGTGSRVVNGVAAMLQERKHPINDGKITCVVFDTDQGDNHLIKNSGTDIPVIPTCDDKKIRAYLDRYAHRNVLDWCPTSPAFLGDDMKGGASEVRVKSRLAFMDTLENGGIQKFVTEVEKIFHARSDTKEKLRVLIVSSLSGGTGSGMFIQLSLWLRQFFADRNCDATIRGVLLLPDIFVNTLDVARENPRKKLYYYANAYAAIREVNAINKLVKDHDFHLDKPMIIDGLFKSEPAELRPEKPVFDNAFFMDYADYHGASYSNIGEYEQIAAQVVYMQLYAPMYNEMISVEDNLYRSFEANPEPAYGSCGTAKIEYPTMDVVNYCALRAAHEAVDQGWYRLDHEIEAAKKKLEQQQKDGQRLSEKFSVRDEYVSLFDQKAAKKEKDVGAGDRLFVTIRSQVKVQSRTKSTTENGDDTLTTQEACKASLFLNALDTRIRGAVEKTCKAELDAIKAVGDNLPEPDKIKKVLKDDVKECKAARETEISAITCCLDAFDGEGGAHYKNRIINNITRELVPMDMGSVTMNDEKSLYSLFLSTDLDGVKTVVHPVAARYLLYKLLQLVEVQQSKLVSDANHRSSVLTGSNPEIFDNPGTKHTKETLEQYFDQVGLILDAKELAFFCDKYKEYNRENWKLCLGYCVNEVKRAVLCELAEHLRELIKVMEDTFAGFADLQKELEQQINANIKLNVMGENSKAKVMYVYAQEGHKDEMYKTLNIDPYAGNAALNKSVVDAVYGKFCAKNMPSSEDNQKYLDWSTDTLVRNAMIAAYTDTIKESKDKINLNIMQAIRKEAEYDYANRKVRDADEDFINNEDEEKSGNESRAAAAERRFRQAVIDYKEKLLIRSVPFLSWFPDETDEEAARQNLDHVAQSSLEDKGGIYMTTEDGEKLYMPYQTRLTFWGFREELLKDCANLEGILSVNKKKSCSNGYRRNELCCYRSVYGVTAAKIKKFNELSGGDYYKHYSAVINTMNQSGRETDTPHLDKTWHEFLPFVSPTREEENRKRFGKTFWRAVAYGNLSLDPSKKYYQLTQMVKSRIGKDRPKTELLKDEYGQSIGATDICSLVAALRVHPEFTASLNRALEEKYLKDIRNKARFEDTEFFSSLLKDENNPITMMDRFQRSRRYDEETKFELLSLLEDLIKDVAENLDYNRDVEYSVERSMYQQLCKLYDRSTANKKALVVREVEWLEKALKHGAITKAKYLAEMKESDIAVDASEDGDAE